MDHVLPQAHLESNPAQAETNTAQQKTFWQRNKLFLILTAVLLAIALAAAAGIGYIYYVIHPYEGYDRIMPNVSCAGIDLSGLTRQEAQALIEETLRYPSHSLKLILPDGEYTFEPRQEGITLNGASIAQRAYAYGRADTSAFGLYKAYRQAEKTQYRLSAETALDYNREDIQAQAETISRDTYIAPTDSVSACDAASHLVTITPGTPGRIIRAEQIYQVVCNAYDTMTFDDMTLEYETVDIDLAQLKDVCLDAAYDYHVSPVAPVVSANEETHAIDLIKGTEGWKLNGNALYEQVRQAVEAGSYDAITVEMEPVAPLDPDLNAAVEALSCEPSEPYYYGGTVYEGTSGYSLDWKLAAEQIDAAAYGESIQIPLTETAPRRTAEEIRAVLFRDQLSSYRTEHVANSNRTNNLSLACEAINGTVLNAGETFSFNDVVGERTWDKGYRSATVYVGSDSVEQLGGGICQVASTIYDAALYAEMEITSRDCHTFFVTYVPGGLDATVYWGALDFCFRNNTDYPVRINAWVSGGYVNISLDGTKTNDHTVELSSVWLGTNPYSTIYRYDSSKPRGYESETVYPYTGYTYEAYQYIYDGSGNLLETNYLGKSTYEKRDQVITIGTG